MLFQELIYHFICLYHYQHNYLYQTEELCIAYFNIILICFTMSLDVYFIESFITLTGLRIIIFNLQSYQYLFKCVMRFGL